MALLAPVTVIAALAVLALSGGFGGLSALGQLVSGPAVPVGSNPPGGRTSPASAPQLLPVVPASGARTAAATAGPSHVAAVSPPVTGTGGAGAGGGSRTGGGGGQRSGTGGGHGATPPVNRPAPTQPAPPVSTPAPPPATGPVPALLNSVVAVGVSVTSKLPAPLAAIGTGALQSLGQTLDSLLAPHS